MKDSSFVIYCVESDRVIHNNSGHLCWGMQYEKIKVSVYGTYGTVGREINGFPIADPHIISYKDTIMIDDYFMNNTTELPNKGSMVIEMIEKLWALGLHAAFVSCDDNGIPEHLGGTWMIQGGDGDGSIMEILK